MNDMKKSLLLLLATTAFNNPSWKLDDNGAVVMKDGNPVYLDTNGNEMTVQTTTISKLNAEAKNHRELKESLEARLKSYEGIDSVKAREALELVTKLDQKKLIDSGEVDKVRGEVANQFQQQLSEKDKELNEVRKRYDDSLIDGAFSNSDFIRDNVAVPRDMFQATFRNNFKVEDGKVVAYGKDGNRLLSKVNAGEYATAEEAFQILVESHQQKEVILRANTGNGAGGRGGDQRPGGRYVKRGDFSKMTAHEQATISEKVRKGEMTLTD